jgi:glycosyltransferase involved in cell wall biosynthesis
VQIDLSLLRERYAVSEWYQRSRGVNLLDLVHAVVKSDLVFGWFASWHTFFPVLIARMLGRTSVLVVGGYDTANMTEIAYGSQRGGIKQWIVQMTMQLATHLIAFSEFSRSEAIRHTNIEPFKISMIYLGLENLKYPLSRKEPMAITVGNVDRSNLQRKGLEMFVRAASCLPQIPFILIGAWRDDTINYLRSIASPNVQFTGWVSDQELRDYFSRARVYVQASRHEGFGLAVAEAMLCECIPVVTRAGALPEVVGNTGIYIDSTESKVLAEGVQRALIVDGQLGKDGRERVMREFPLERRREQMYQLIEKILKHNCGDAS